MAWPSVLLLLGGLGTGEVIFLIFLFVLLFGAHKIPDLARSLGKAQREFQKARDEVAREVAASSATPSPPVSEADRVRKAAADLGIATEGRTTDEVKSLIAQRMRPGG